MLDNGITNGTYALTADTTLSDLNKFQNFLLRNFKVKFTHYKDTRPTIAKTQKFNLVDDKTVEN